MSNKEKEICISQKILKYVNIKFSLLLISLLFLITIVLYSSTNFTDIIFFPQISNFNYSSPIQDDKNFIDLSHNNLTRIQFGARWIDIINGRQYDTIQRDIPDEMRPPALIAFYCSKSWPEIFTNIDFYNSSETILPSRERLSIYTYDLDSVPYRSWYIFTPEMDLALRFNITKCPTIVIVPPSCNGWTEWCFYIDKDNPTTKFVGCKGFKDQCTGYKQYVITNKTDKKQWLDWVQNKIKKYNEPKIAFNLKTHEKQADWIITRQNRINQMFLLETNLIKKLPKFTKTGFELLNTPQNFQDYLIHFWKRNNKKTRQEEQSIKYDVFTNYHEIPTTFVDLKEESRICLLYAEKYIKPLVEKWSGVEDLELTSFYGIREYPPNARLTSHIDKIETHILSVTFSIAKLDPKTYEIIEDIDNVQDWPLEVISFNGKTLRIPHKPGTMILYESSTVVHGRPYKNPNNIHLSAFMHFAPKKYKDQTWKEYISYIKDQNYIFDNVEKLEYKSTPSIEPKNPKFTESIK